MKFRWTLIACLALLTSCGKEIPDEIIQPSKMERVLYDYHLTLGMSENSKNTEKEARKNYIFQKHGITSAEFDSSMVWYTRESKELMSIYENLNKRFKREYEHVERLLESREEANTRSFASGDTVDVWMKENILWFTKSPLNNRLTFEIKADSTFHPKDAFDWNMDYYFMTEGEAIMGLNVIYENDSVIGMTKSITESGPQSIYLHTDSAYNIKSLNGFVYVPQNQAKQPNILLHKINLTRYHMPDPTDSLSTDSVSATQEIKKESPKKQPSIRKEKPRKAARMEKIEKQ
jgi:hypothetical protein